MANSSPKFLLKNTFTESAEERTFSPPSPPSLEVNLNEKPGEENPFLKRGPKKPHRMAHVKGLLQIRVDMPGCSNDDLKFWVDGSMVHFFAKARPDPARGFPGREYGGSNLINPALYKVEEAAAKIADGIFWITVPMRVPALDVEGPESSSDDSEVSE